MHRLPLGDRALAASIALLAGYVDAVGFVGYGAIFVSFMSGNSTRLGADIALLDAVAAMKLLGVITSFVAGVAAASLLASRRRSAALVAACLALAAIVGLAPDVPANATSPGAALAAMAFAMGAANALMAEAPVGLTYMTGTLVRLGQALAQVVRSGRATPVGAFLVHWSALVLGAGLGAFAFARLGIACLWFAVGLFALLSLRSR